MRYSVVSAAKRSMTILLVLMLCTSAAGGAARNVYMNGEKQNALNIAVFDSQIGSALPDGRYWYDPVSGEWGVEGDTDAVGNIYTGTLYQGADEASDGGDGMEGEVSTSVNGTAGTGRDAEGRDCAFVSTPDGAGMMTCD